MLLFLLPITQLSIIMLKSSRLILENMVEYQVQGSIIIGLCVFIQSGMLLKKDLIWQKTSEVTLFKPIMMVMH